MYRITWPQMKSLLDKKAVRARYVESTDDIEIISADQSLQFVCSIIKGTDEESEFTLGYQADIDSHVVGQVVTASELDYIVLKMARQQAQADANGDATISMRVPGSFANVERYAAGGYAITDSYTWDDAITRVEIVDTDGVTGAPSGTVLKSYHDEDVPEENRGWYFWKSHGNEGECEIEPIGWYGQLRGELDLRITFKLAPLAKIKADLWWGKKE